MKWTNTNLYVETGAAGAGASFPTGVCFLERDPSLHDYTIQFQCRGSKLQHQGIPSDCHHRLRSGTPLRESGGKHATSFRFPRSVCVCVWGVILDEGLRRGSVSEGQQLYYVWKEREKVSPLPLMTHVLCLGRCACVCGCACVCLLLHLKGIKSRTRTDARQQIRHRPWEGWVGKASDLRGQMTQQDHICHVIHTHTHTPSLMRTHTLQQSH